MRFLSAFFEGWTSGHSIEISGEWMAVVVAFAVAVVSTLFSIAMGVFAFGLWNQHHEGHSGAAIVVGFAVFMLFGVMAQTVGIGFHSDGSVRDGALALSHALVAALATAARAVWLMVTAIALGSLFRNVSAGVLFVLGFMICHAGCVCFEVLLGQQHAWLAAMLLWLVGMVSVVRYIVAECEGQLSGSTVGLVLLLLACSVLAQTNTEHQWLIQSENSLADKMFIAFHWIVYGPAYAFIFWVIAIVIGLGWALMNHNK